MSVIGEGLIQGAQFGNLINDAREQRRQRAEEDAARAAMASAIPSPDAPRNPDGSAHPEGFMGHLKDLVHGFYDHLHKGALNDNHVANGSMPIPSDPGMSMPTPQAQGGPAIPQPTTPQEGATAAAAQVAATDPAAQQGVPQQSPSESGKKAHSLDSNYWDDNQEHILAATRAAVLAGKDPNQVYTALTAVRTGFFQSQILKNLSAANMALQNGDTKAVEQAMKNVYYYFPDGQDLKIHHGADGQMQYQDPFNPTDENGKPNFVDIDASHIQLLGQAALDPQKVNDTIQGAKSAEAKRQLDIAKAIADEKNAQGSLLRGEAAMLGSKNAQRLIPSQIYKNVATGAYDEARANFDDYRLRYALRNAGRGLVPGAQKAADAAASYTYSLFQGQPETVPTEVQGKTGMIPNLSPAAGHTIRNPKLAPTWLKGKTPEQLATIANTAGHIAAANFGTMSKDEAVRLGAQVEDARGKYHDGHPNLLVSKDGLVGQLWQGKAADGTDLGYRTFKLTADQGSSILNGVGLPSPPELESGAEDAAPTEEDDSDAG